MSCSYVDPHSLLYLKNANLRSNSCGLCSVHWSYLMICLNLLTLHLLGFTKRIIGSVEVTLCITCQILYLIFIVLIIPQKKYGLLWKRKTQRKTQVHDLKKHCFEILVEELFNVSMMMHSMGTKTHVGVYVHVQDIRRGSGLLQLPLHY